MYGAGRRDQSARSSLMLSICATSGTRSAVIWLLDLHNKKQTNDANDSPSSQPNVHIDPKSKDDRFKLQIRGSMLVALMDISNRSSVLSHTDMPRQQAFQSHDVHSSGQQYQTSQQAHANVDFNEDLATFLDPALGATSSTYDDMLSLNSLLQSSVGLDSTSWLGSTLGLTPEDRVKIKGPSSLTEFLPSL
ncbi:hypothetical protein NDA11_006780 [Ustilago hordei]|uniref:Uncharacterized protein n=1 Tax=Ustilago hordei TaxID=120017 RepID=I2G702_USTHO|nr:hypothetical protein NDA10_004064 [Ustilago hordei]KAJ1585734.1 hypothetical protein NDA12_001267 [Ustilago hordei]KAJ1589131.1 hypothetical protein NDA15_002668 [Ustilago hordei]KAJ1591173.1 hypothetical protein NDA11_006780 [Ustilago hordei]CCF54945.1 uncharacterized protein UHOR_01257 [Ustilago hordei]